MTRTLRALALTGLLLVPLAAQAAHAQTTRPTPTPEGTVIKNEATASFTDANGNSYTDVKATVSLTVGYKANMDLIAGATATPASPSTGNVLDLTINNDGNGADHYAFDSITLGTGLVIKGFKIGSGAQVNVTDAADLLAKLNTALATTSIQGSHYDTNGTTVLPGGSQTVTLIYDVAAGSGGQSPTIVAKGHPSRDETNSDQTTTTVSPPTAQGVTVTPATATATKLPTPSGGAAYTQTFTVKNTGNASATFTVAATAGAGLSLASWTNVSATLAPGATQEVTVSYTVASDAAAGATPKLTLTATQSDNSSVAASGVLTVTVIRASVSMTKKAYDAKDGAEITGTIVPGQDVWYKITVKNDGEAPAKSVKITDKLPAAVTLAATNPIVLEGTGVWTIDKDGSADGTIEVTLNADLTKGSSHYVWVHVTVK